MLKKLILFCFLLSIFNITNAEIIQTTNDFNNSKNIYSLSPKQKQQFPKYFIFKKNINNNSLNYFVTIQNDNGVTKHFANTENFNLKINDKDIYTFSPRFSEISGGVQATIHLDNKFMENFDAIKKIIFQVPIFAERTSILETYYYIEVPQSILDEWKQVIAME